MDLKSQLNIALQESHYDTWLTSVDDIEALGFEDSSVMGFACIFGTAAQLLERWREAEMKLLTTHSSSLQRAEDKTWNIYSVFISNSIASEPEARQIRWIEENLERTRKIAAFGVTDRTALMTALLPLLPLQYQPILDTDDFDLTHRLSKRIASIAPTAAGVALSNTVEPAEVARLLASTT